MKTKGMAARALLRRRWPLPTYVQPSLAVRTPVASFSVLSEPMIEYLETLKPRHQMLAKKMESHDLSPSEMRQTGKKYAELSEIVSVIQTRNEIKKNIAGCLSVEKEAEKDQEGEELAELAKAEREEAEEQLNELDINLMKMIIPSDDDDKASSMVLEVRAGTGGDEASLFASEIFRMYQLYSEVKGWKWELLSLSKTDIGGFKEAQATMKGDAVFKLMKFEAGVHRVQRIPVNDTKIQTSAASVIVMPEPEDVQIDIRPQDLRIDVFRAGGAGGQSVNKTESAVRMTHIPTGVVVSMQVRF
jgi:peptide chain release factor 1